MCSLEKRPRILYNPTRLPVIEDEMAYIKNKSSENAKRIKSINSNLVFDVWIDKHYQIRRQFGDEAGARDGIDIDKVEALILKSIKHLVAYGSILKTFTFVNHNLTGGRANRIVLQEETENGKLNVVIEGHFIDVDTCEITVITAMRADDFKLGDGQFSVEIFGNESVLKRMEKGSVKEIYNL
jgi:hypothetical protein